MQIEPWFLGGDGQGLKDWWEKDKSTLKWKILLFKFASLQNGSMKFGYAHKGTWYSYVAISPGYKISTSLTKIPTPVWNTCPRWPRQSWLGASKEPPAKRDKSSYSTLHHMMLALVGGRVTNSLACQGPSWFWNQNSHVQGTFSVLGTSGHLVILVGDNPSKVSHVFPQMVTSTFKAKLFIFTVSISKNSKDPPFLLLPSQSR